MVDLEEKERCISDLRMKVSAIKLLNTSSLLIQLLTIILLHYQLEEIKSQHILELSSLEDTHTKAVEALKKKLKTENEHFDIKVQNETAKLENMSKELSSKLKAEEEHQASELKSIKGRFHEELNVEKLKAEEADLLYSQQMIALKNEIQRMKKEHDEVSNDIIMAYQLEIRNAKMESEKINEEIRLINTDFVRSECAIQEQVDREISIEHELYEKAALQEAKASTRLKEEIDIKKKKHEELMKDYDEHKESILSLQDKQSELSAQIESVENEMARIREVIRNEEIMISNLEQKTNSLAKTTHEMER